MDLQPNWKLTFLGESTCVGLSLIGKGEISMRRFGEFTIVVRYLTSAVK